MLYSLAATAMVVVAPQIIFFVGDPQIVWAEVVALIAVVITLVLGRRAGWHDRWLAARYLAERIRCGVFLAATGAGDGLRPRDGRPRDGRPRDGRPRDGRPRDGW